MYRLLSGFTLKFSMNKLLSDIKKFNIKDLRYKFLPDQKINFYKLLSNQAFQFIVRALIIVLLLFSLKNSFSEDDADDDDDDPVEKWIEEEGAMDLSFTKKPVEKPKKKEEKPKKPKIPDDIDHFHRYCHRRNLGVDVKPKVRLRQSMRISERSYEIPEIIHQLSPVETVPKYFEKWMRTWLKLHPHWQYWFWDEKDVQFFMKTRYPDFNKLFVKYPADQQLEVFKYFLLHEFGGVYADLDMECVKPFDEIIQMNDCIFSSESMLHRLMSPTFTEHPHLMSTSLVACRARHPYLKYTIDFLEGFGHFGFEPKRRINYMMEKSLISFLREGNVDTQPYVPKRNIFQPGFNVDIVETIKKSCETMDTSDQDYQMLQAIALCKQLKDSKIPEDLHKKLCENAVTVRHWKQNSADLLMGGNDYTRVKDWKGV